MCCVIDTCKVYCGAGCTRDLATCACAASGPPGARSAGREKCAAEAVTCLLRYQRMPLIARLQRPRVADQFIRCDFLLATLTTF